MEHHVHVLGYCCVSTARQRHNSSGMGRCYARESTTAADGACLVLVWCAAVTIFSKCAIPDGVQPVLPAHVAMYSLHVMASGSQSRKIYKGEGHCVAEHQMRLHRNSRCQAPALNMAHKRCQSRMMCTNMPLSPCCFIQVLRQWITAPVLKHVKPDLKHDGAGESDSKHARR